MEKEEIESEVIEKEKSPKKKKGKWKLILVLIVTIIFAIYSYVNYRAQFLEISEIGEEYIEIYNQNNTYLKYIALVNFVIIFISVFITNIIIKRGLKKFFLQEGKPIPKLANKSLAFIIALIVSILTSSWLLKTTMSVINATQFNITDPIFNSDVSFYMFQKPFIEMILYYFIVLFIGLAIYTGIYYIISFNIFFESIDGKMLRGSSFIKQLLTYAMLIIIGIAMLVIVKTQGIIFNSFLNLNDKEGTLINGAGLTERYIEVWGYRILAIVMVIAVYMAIKAFNRRQSRKIIVSLLSVPAYLVIMFIVMLGYQVVYVKQNELDKQKEYISKNIEFTKTAYNINVEDINIENTDTLSSEEANKYHNVIENIPIVNSEIVLSTLTEKQDKTGYYLYNYTRPTLYNSKLAYVSAREISNESRTDNNKTYEYTHGYGAVVTSASEVDESGNLLYLSNDFNDTNKIKQPRIYYGLRTNDIVVINNNYKEVDYPISSTQNAETKYEGEGGLKAEFLDRLILGIKQKKPKLAFESSDSSILINRNIVRKKKKVMPHLLYDDEPYLVITDSENENVIGQKSYVIKKKKNASMINEASYSLDESIKIDYDYYNEIANKFKLDYGLDTKSYLKVYLKVHKQNSSSISTYKINDTKESLITIPLSQRAINIKMDSEEISGEAKVKSNSDMTRTNYICIFLSLLFLILILVKFIKLIKLILLLGDFDSKYDRYINKLLNEYDRLIVETTNMPDLNQFEVIKISKFTELLDVRDNLKLPIMYYVVAKHHKSYFYIKKDNDIYLLTVKETDF